jgi:hypothetical protein
MRLHEASLQAAIFTSWAMRVFQPQSTWPAKAYLVIPQLVMLTEPNRQAIAWNREVASELPYLSTTSFVEPRAEPQETTTR